VSIVLMANEDRAAGVYLERRALLGDLPGGRVTVKTCREPIAIRSRPDVQ